jgi:beta-lactamase class A
MKFLLAGFAMMAIVAPGHAKLGPSLNAYLKTQPGLVAVAFKNLETGETCYLRDNTVMHAASTMKVAVMIEAYRQSEQATFRMSDSITVSNLFHSIVDGSEFSLPVNADEHDPTFAHLQQPLSYRELVYNMITWSSNLATNILIDRLGAAQVQRTISKLGARHMRVRRGVEDSLAYNRGWNNETTSRDLLVLLEAIATHKAASANSCADMLAILGDQHYRDKIPAGLPPAVKVAHKTGSITAINHDAAVITLPDGRRYILVVLSKGITEQKRSNEIIAHISRMVYDHVIAQNQ